MSIRITGGLVNTQIAGPTPRFLIQKAWGGADDLFAFLTGPLGDAAAAGLGVTLGESRTILDQERINKPLCFLLIVFA